MVGLIQKLCCDMAEPMAGAQVPQRLIRRTGELVPLEDLRCGGQDEPGCGSRWDARSAS